MKRMQDNFLQEVFEIAFRLQGLYKSKNPIKRIQAYLIYLITMYRIRYISDKISPYYEWYHNTITFMNRIKYKSDIVKYTEVVTEEQFQISKLSIKIDNQIYQVQFNIPFDMDKKPIMSINIHLPNNNFKHYILSDNDIIDYLESKSDIVKATYLYKLVHTMNDELYKSCKYALSGKWRNNVN